MNHLYVLIISQKNTLIKGWFISTLIVLPFTFIPTWIEFGFSLEETLYRVSHSILYSLALGLKEMLDPIKDASVAFKGGRAMLKLGLERANRFDESIIDEQYSFLGKVGNYYFLINLIEPESEKCIIEILMN